MTEQVLAILEADTRRPEATAEGMLQVVIEPARPVANSEVATELCTIGRVLTAACRL